MDRELGGVEAVSREANAVLRGGLKGGPPVEPVAGSDSALVGTSVEFALAAVDGAVREPLIGGAPTPEMAYQRTHAGELAVAELQRLVAGGSRPTGPTLERLADCALVCGRLEQRYRVGPFRARELALADPAIGEPEGLAGTIRATDASAETRADLVTLLEAGIRDTADLYAAGTLHIDPVFALSSALGGADADVIADGVLIDFKASRARSVIGAPDVYQLVGYALADLYDWYAIRSVGIHALRWRTRWTMPLEDLLHRPPVSSAPFLSGARGSAKHFRPMTRSSRCCAAVARRRGDDEAADTRCAFSPAATTARSSPTSMENWPCCAPQADELIPTPNPLGAAPLELSVAMYDRPPLVTRRSKQPQ
jgi:hypothetical protein